MDTNTDIISFDAFSYMDHFLLFSETIARFIRGGGIVAWGMVPTFGYTGKETLEGHLPAVIAGQKGIVEEKDLRIPNMRGIMMARKKPLQIMTPVEVSASTRTEKFEKPAAKGECKMVDAGDLDQLIDLLHNEAKVL